MDYCNNCFPRDNSQNNGQRRNRCRRCRILSMEPLERQSLMSLRIRDLKWYLEKKNMSYKYCKVSLLAISIFTNKYYCIKFTLGKK